MSERLNAATKDMIRASFRNETNALSKEKEKVEDSILIERVNKIKATNEYKALVDAIVKFEDIRRELDEDDVYIDSCIRRAYEYIVKDNLVTVPNWHRERYIGQDDRIDEINNKITAINKKCNKLIFDLEMAPKKSDAYREAYETLSEMMFSKEESNNEE